MNMTAILRILCAVLPTGLASLLSYAGTATFTGNTAGLSLWQRPIGNGTNPPSILSSMANAVPFLSCPFKVSAGGTYDFLGTSTTPSNWDNYSFVYSNSIDATQPLMDVLIGNDDFSTVGKTGFNGVPLIAERQYFYVMTGFQNGDFGAFTATITGPGDITVICIPEPSAATLALAGSLSSLWLSKHLRGRVSKASADKGGSGWCARTNLTSDGTERLLGARARTARSACRSAQQFAPTRQSRPLLTIHRSPITSVALAKPSLPTRNRPTLDFGLWTLRSPQPVPLYFCLSRRAHVT
jgi:hypothetical protein